MTTAERGRSARLTAETTAERPATEGPAAEGPAAVTTPEWRRAARPTAETTGAATRKMA